VRDSDRDGDITGNCASVKEPTVRAQPSRSHDIRLRGGAAGNSRAAGLLDSGAASDEGGPDGRAASKLNDSYRITPDFFLNRQCAL
jgi:hypothetical protein